MGQRKVKLKPLDTLIHYSLAIYFGLPVLIFVGHSILGQLGLFGIKSSFDMSVALILGGLFAGVSLLIYSIQRNKLRFQFIPTSTDIEESRKLIKEIAKGQKWAIRSFKENMYTIKTNPGFVNESWGQHITIQLVKGGVLVNSIFDPNKGSWLITFGSNQKNIDNIKRTIEGIASSQRNDWLMDRRKV